MGKEKEKEIEKDVEETEEEVKEEKEPKKKDNKKIYVILGAVIIALLLIICLLWKNLNSSVKVTFKTDGGTEVKEQIVKKGSTITLPTTTKEGYNFKGWYIGSEKQKSSIKVEKNTTVTAKWEKIPEGVKTFTITFDSKGGSKVEKMILECDKEISLPEAPTKDGYNFTSWVDQNETPILDKALLACEDVTLYAKWEKKEEKQEEKKEEPKKEKKKEYSCPDGYTLEGTKCKMEGAVHTRCPEGTKTDGEKCVNTSDKNTGNRVCPTKTVQTTASHTETVEGEYFSQGAGYCGYYVYKTLQTQADCNAAYDKNTVWANGKCYAKIVINDYTTVCSDGYEWYTTQQLAQWNIHDGGKCIRVVGKESYCDDGFTLTDGKCIKTIDAKEK